MQVQKKTEASTRLLGTKAANAQKIIQYLYVKPRINAEKIANLLTISPASSYSLIKDLENIGILKEVTGAQRGRVYVFDEYLKIFTH